MNTTLTNARRMVCLIEQMRDRRPSPFFARLKELKLSYSHMRALQILAPDRRLPMKDLAEQLQMTPPSVTALTRRLIQTDLVERTTLAADSRVVQLSLTDTGRAFLQQLTQEHIDRMAQLLEGLTQPEQELFLDLMERAIMAQHSISDETTSQADSASARDAASETPTPTNRRHQAQHRRDRQYANPD